MCQDKNIWLREEDPKLLRVEVNDNYTPDNTVKIYAHSSGRFIVGPNGEHIYKAEQLDQVLTGRSRACNAGHDDKGFATHISSSSIFKNVVIVAPSDYYMSNRVNSWINRGGQYTIILNGKLVRGKYSSYTIP
ncbi:hypothetical protein [Chryseobacterium sp.]|uniref:hypothetical protein n=1 Tax=Chryseobacterium sp. TaxID=1871047 RepID=UPI002FCC084B